MTKEEAVVNIIENRMHSVFPFESQSNQESEEVNEKTGLFIIG